MTAANLVERLFGGMRKRGHARQSQKARASLDRVHHPKDEIELRPVGGIGLPHDQRPAGIGKDFRRFSQKIVQKIVHRGSAAPQNQGATMTDNG